MIKEPCPKCGESKPTEEFFSTKNCQACRDRDAEYQRRYHAKNPDKVRKTNRKASKRKRDKARGGPSDGGIRHVQRTGEPLDLYVMRVYLECVPNLEPGEVKALTTWLAMRLKETGGSDE